ncbi:MAG: hypothetical protein J6T60_15725 [Bacteroidales bacterium]|nr:hypothetical protein [Bacteroidales bacterium]MBO7568535.1 hypothetical protein [Bacteroidales bacterium]
MKTNIEELETTDAAITTDATTNETKEIVEAEEPKTGRMAWAIAHKGIIEIVDPELRSQLSYYRKRDKKKTQNTFQEEVSI